MTRQDMFKTANRGTGCPLMAASMLALMWPRLRAVIIASALLAVASTPATSQVDPRAPGAIALPELGRLTGSLKCVTAVLERFGFQIYPIGDVDGDSLNDWVLTHRRCDTSFNGLAIIELLLYHGVRGGLPPASAGIRIGPSEINANCSFIGAGDYDGDGHRDIAISQRILDDPYSGEYSFSSIVVYWNDGAGRYSTSDTTHMTAPNQRICVMFPDNERWARVPERCDIDRDGAEDLVIVSYGAERTDTVRSPYPWVVIHRGHRGRRWGRNGVSTRPDWQLWQRLFIRRVSVIDHDGDGALDIVMHVDKEDNWGMGELTILYGRREALPDTIGQYIGLAPFDGKAGVRTELIDLTGDRVPELIVTIADTVDRLLTPTRRWLVYVGRRGQRLREQYGSGNDAPRPGDSLWWGRPWTIIVPPSEINAAWSASSHTMFDPGDIGLDGIDDFCATSYPGIVCYNGGGRLDSWIDAGASVWPADLDRGHLAKLGDIDGSKRAAFGVSDGRGIAVFYRSDPRVPRGGEPIRLPEGTDRPVSAPSIASTTAPSLELAITPNPATAHTRLRWTSVGGGTSVALLDMRGRELRRWLLPPGADELESDLTGLPGGVYFVTVTNAGRSVSLPLVYAP